MLGYRARCCYCYPQLRCCCCCPLLRSRVLTYATQCLLLCASFTVFLSHTVPFFVSSASLTLCFSFTIFSLTHCLFYCAAHCLCSPYVRVADGALGTVGESEEAVAEAVAMATAVTGDKMELEEELATVLSEVCTYSTCALTAAHCLVA